MQDAPRITSRPQCLFPYCLLPVYQDFDPWQEFEQVREVAFQPGVAAMFVTPFMCVAAVTAVGL